MQKTEGAVFQGKQMEVLGKASIWLLFKKNRILLFLFAGGWLGVERKFQEYLKTKVVSAGTSNKCVLHKHELLLQSQSLQKWFKY